MRPEGPRVSGALLFTPGDRPERFEKGRVASHGALILDLEDAVASERKAAARDAVADWLASGNACTVRINSVGTPAFEDDVARLAGSRLAAILVPKTDSARDVAAVRKIWPRAVIYPLIESPQGLEDANAIARCEGVAQLALGALDLHASLGMTFPNATFLDYARIRLVIASGIARLPGPIDSPFPGFKDPLAVLDDAAAAARLGFSAKLCIHPAQVEPVNRAFMPSESELAWAREVVEAGKAGGVATVRGAMVDAPVLESARQILARGERLQASA